MARIPREIVDEVRERTDIAEVISRHVSLVRRGRNMVGLCPFHQEKSPSFNVIPDKGIYHCFGCQAGGDVFRFLMTLEGLSFIEAVKELAEPIGVTIEERELTHAERKQLRQRATAFDVLEATAAFYEGQLWTGAAGEPARGYLEKRAMSVDAARAARLGWAPGGWSRLLDHLHREGYDAVQVAEAGVARARDPDRADTGFYDTLRERLTIPIRDERGRVVAFGGRLLEGDGPKYINTPETRLYQKSHILYALDAARVQIQKKGRVLVVEGYFDVLSLHQAGFGEAVATCGTALTASHLEKLRRLTRDVVLVMDADEAGLRAAEKSLPLFVDAGVQPWRLDLTAGTGVAKDPDDFVRQNGPEAFTRALEHKEPLFEWVVRRKLDAYGTSTMSRERVLADVLPMLARLRDDPTLASRVAARLGLDETSLLKRVREASLAPVATPTAEVEAESAAPVWQPHRDVNHLLWLVVHRYGEVADLMSRADPSLLDEHLPVRPVLARLLSGEPVAAVLPEVVDAGVQKALLAVVSRDGLYGPDDDAVKAMLQILARLARPVRAARIAAAQAEFESAIAAGDSPRAAVAIRAKKVLQDRQRALDEALRRGDVDLALSLLGPGENRGP